MELVLQSETMCIAWGLSLSHACAWHWLWLHGAGLPEAGAQAWPRGGIVDAVVAYSLWASVLRFPPVICVQRQVPRRDGSHASRVLHSCVGAHRVGQCLANNLSCAQCSRAGNQGQLCVERV